MSNLRDKDQVISSIPNRRERVFMQQDLWYFRTRDGDDVSPFRYRSEAENNLNRFMHQLESSIQQTG